MVSVEEDERFVPLDVSANGEEAVQDPFALPLSEFIKSVVDAPPPLLGSDAEVIFPLGGLGFLAGQSGVGKTTLAVDLAFHLASGRDWLVSETYRGFGCPRPLRILIVENEGPREMFRQKVASKSASWKHDLEHEPWVQVWQWASFTLLDGEAHKRFGDFCDRQEVDLVIGDPLGTLGMSGVGAPDDTLAFRNLLLPLGLTERRSFLFLAHLRKEKADDDLNRLQGAWGNHLDMCLSLKDGNRKSELELWSSKFKWAAEREPIILGKMPAVQSFEALHEKDAPEELVRPIIEYLEANPGWHTIAEIHEGADAKGKRERFEATLNQNDNLFRAVPGAVGDRPKAKWVFQLSSQIGKAEKSSEPHNQADSPPGLFAVPDKDDEW